MNLLSTPILQPSPGSAPPALESAQARSARMRRLSLAIIAVVLMGLADLAYTLTYMRTSGMIEANPIARAMISVGDAPQLILFKVFSMSLCCGALYLAREHRKAEAAAWACSAVMLVLTFHWMNYNRDVSGFTNELVTLAISNGEYEPRWVKLD